MASTCNSIVQGIGKGRRNSTLKAAASLYPGHLCEEASATTCQKHSGAALNGIPCVAEQQGELNKGTTDAYAQNDFVKLYYPLRGEQVYVRVAAGATAITVGAFLESAGDGTVRILTTDAATDDTQRASVLFQADEAVDNSGGSAEVFVLATAL